MGKWENGKKRKWEEKKMGRKENGKKTSFLINHQVLYTIHLGVSNSHTSQLCSVHCPTVPNPLHAHILHPSNHMTHLVEHTGSKMEINSIVK